MIAGTAARCEVRGIAVLLLVAAQMAGSPVCPGLCAPAPAGDGVGPPRVGGHAVATAPTPGATATIALSGSAVHRVAADAEPPCSAHRPGAPVPLGSGGDHHSPSDTDTASCPSAHPTVTCPPPSEHAAGSMPGPIQQVTPAAALDAPLSTASFTTLRAGPVVPAARPAAPAFRPLRI